MISRTRIGPWGVEATAARLADIHGALVASVHCLGAWIAGVPALETKIDWANLSSTAQSNKVPLGRS